MLIYKVRRPAHPSPPHETIASSSLACAATNAYFSQDIVTGDEIISDTYKLIEKDDVVYEVNCKKVTKGGENFDIGANPSAEEAEEGLDESTKQVIDVVDSFRFNFLGDEESGSRAFKTKKDFMGQFKSTLMANPRNRGSLDSAEEF